MPTGAYRSQLGCIVGLIACGECPGVDGPLLCPLAVIQHKRGCQQHVVRELVALQHMSMLMSAKPPVKLTESSWCRILRVQLLDSIIMSRDN